GRHVEWAADEAGPAKYQQASWASDRVLATEGQGLRPCRKSRPDPSPFLVRGTRTRKGPTPRFAVIRKTAILSFRLRLHSCLRQIGGGLWRGCFGRVNRPCPSEVVQTSEGLKTKYEDSEFCLRQTCALRLLLRMIAGAHQRAAFDVAETHGEGFVLEE